MSLPGSTAQARRMTPVGSAIANSIASYAQIGVRNTMPGSYDITQGNMPVPTTSRSVAGKLDITAAADLRMAPLLLIEEAKDFLAKGDHPIFTVLPQVATEKIDINVTVLHYQDTAMGRAPHDAPIKEAKIEQESSELGLVRVAESVLVSRDWNKTQNTRKTVGTQLRVLLNSFDRAMQRDAVNAILDVSENLARNLIMSGKGGAPTLEQMFVARRFSVGAIHKKKLGMFKLVDNARNAFSMSGQRPPDKIIVSEAAMSNSILNNDKFEYESVGRNTESKLSQGRNLISNMKKMAGLPVDVVTFPVFPNGLENGRRRSGGASDTVFGEILWMPGRLNTDTKGYRTSDRDVQAYDQAKGYGKFSFVEVLDRALRGRFSGGQLDEKHDNFTDNNWLLSYYANTGAKPDEPRKGESPDMFIAPAHHAGSRMSNEDQLHGQKFAKVRYFGDMTEESLPHEFYDRFGRAFAEKAGITKAQSVALRTLVVDGANYNPADETVQAFFFAVAQGPVGADGSMAPVSYGLPAPPRVSGGKLATYGKQEVGMDKHGKFTATKGDIVTSYAMPQIAYGYHTASGILALDAAFRNSADNLGYNATYVSNVRLASGAISAALDLSASVFDQGSPFFNANLVAPWLAVGNTVDDRRTVLLEALAGQARTGSVFGKSAARVAADVLVDARNDIDAAVQATQNANAGLGAGQMAEVKNALTPLENDATVAVGPTADALVDAARNSSTPALLKVLTSDSLDKAIKTWRQTKGVAYAQATGLDPGTQEDTSLLKFLADNFLDANKVKAVNGNKTVVADTMGLYLSALARGDRINTNNIQWAAVRADSGNYGMDAQVEGASAMDIGFINLRLAGPNSQNWRSLGASDASLFNAFIRPSDPNAPGHVLGVHIYPGAPNAPLAVRSQFVASVDAMQAGAPIRGRAGIPVVISHTSIGMSAGASLGAHVSHFVAGQNLRDKFAYINDSVEDPVAGMAGRLLAATPVSHRQFAMLARANLPVPCDIMILRYYRLLTTPTVVCIGGRELGMVAYGNYQVTEQSLGHDTSKLAFSAYLGAKVFNRDRLLIYPDTNCEGYVLGRTTDMDAMVDFDSSHHLDIESASGQCMVAMMAPFGTRDRLRPSLVPLSGAVRAMLNKRAKITLGGRQKRAFPSMPYYYGAKEIVSIENGKLGFELDGLFASNNGADHRLPIIVPSGKTVLWNKKTQMFDCPLPDHGMFGPNSSRPDAAQVYEGNKGAFENSPEVFSC